MGYAQGTRRLVYELSGKTCSYCGEHIGWKDFICHHIINRKDGGNSDLRNLSPRHSWCETECHSLYKNGNPREGVKSNDEERGVRKHRHHKKHRHSSMRLRRKTRNRKEKNRQAVLLPTQVSWSKMPRAYFRTVRRTKEVQVRQVDEAMKGKRNSVLWLTASEKIRVMPWYTIIIDGFEITLPSDSWGRFISAYKGV